MRGDTIFGRQGEHRLYGDLAWLFPILLPLEDYISEAAELSRLISGLSAGPVRTLLHLGSGGGLDDMGFKRSFRVTGVDVSESMIKAARRLNPDVTYAEGDLREVRLGRTFDAVIAVDSLDYMTTREDLRSAFVTAREHLAPGGPFLFLLETTRERFRQNQTDCWSVSRGDVDVVFVQNDYDPDPDDTRLETTMLYLIRRRGKLTVEHDLHPRGLFAETDILADLASAGFVARVEDFRFQSASAAAPAATHNLAFPLFIAVRRGAEAAGGPKR